MLLDLITENQNWRKRFAEHEGATDGLPIFSWLTVRVT